MQATYHVGDVMQPSTQYTLVHKVDHNAIFVFEGDTPACVCGHGVTYSRIRGTYT